MGYKYIDSRSRIYQGLNTEIIDSLNLNQDEIIKWAGLNINRTTLSNYIKGISCPPVDVVIKLAVLCKVSINDLLVVKDEYNEEVKASVVEKEITILYKDGKHSKLLRKVNGRNGEFELPVKIKINSYINRKIGDYSSLSAYQIAYDFPLINITKGSMLITEFNPSLIEEKGNKDHYVVLQKLSSVFVSVLKKVKDEDGISNIKADIYSYIDCDGEIKLATYNQIYSMYKGTIIRIIRNL